MKNLYRFERYEMLFGSGQVQGRISRTRFVYFSLRSFVFSEKKISETVNGGSKWTWAGKTRRLQAAKSLSPARRNQELLSYTYTEQPPSSSHFDSQSLTGMTQETPRRGFPIDFGPPLFFSDENTFFHLCSVSFKRIGTQIPLQRG